ncbi:MAG: dihydrofolate reductase [Clostridiales bacterium]|jgi:dihydrofolate reductase|nr:dihydrofolate reductase [Clostridiales bacterium]
MNLSVAVSQNWGIGYKNELLFRIREDLQRFKKLTTNKIVVMGHNTFKSLPNAKPLPNRINIVLSREKKLHIPGVIICDSINSLENILQNYETENIFVIGGEKIYSQLLNRCRTAYITKVEANPTADAFMPNIDKLPNWQLLEETSFSENEGLMYKYCIYSNKSFFDTPHAH